jgi:hypothetical protein
VPRIPVWPLSRSSTGNDTPSRTSSIGQDTELAGAFGGLTLGPAGIFHDHASTTQRGGYGQWAGPSSGATSSTFSRTGDSRTSTGSHRGRSSSSQAPTASGKVQSGRVTKPTPAPLPKKVEKERPRIILRFGCPMCKAHPERYIGVVGPCTDLKGITPTPKALMWVAVHFHTFVQVFGHPTNVRHREHLKKQHSGDFRCMTCWKWFKSRAELDKHTLMKPNTMRCLKCCMHFTTLFDFE